MLSNVSQMSTAMMSAPSCASLTAWLRPCPRAAPVMNATRPSSLPILGISLLRNARGDDRTTASRPTIRSSRPDDGLVALAARPGQGLAEVGDQVVLALDAAAHPDQVGRDAEPLAVLGPHPGVRGDGRLGDQRFHAAQAHRGIRERH